MTQRPRSQDLEEGNVSRDYRTGRDYCLAGLSMQVHGSELESVPGQGAIQLGIDQFDDAASWIRKHEPRVKRKAG